MTIAALPFNSGPEARPAIARQFINFAAEMVRTHTEAEVNSVNYMIRLDDSPNPRFANVNPSETLNEIDMIRQFFEQANADYVVDGLLENIDGKNRLTWRVFRKGEDEPFINEVRDFDDADTLKVLREMIVQLTEVAGGSLPADTKDDKVLFGTADSAAFIKFLEGFDALQYIDKTQGAVAMEFSPEGAFERLFEALSSDPEWEGPFVATVQLGRACTNYKIGNYEMIDKALRKLIDVVPEDGRIYFALGELNQAVNNLPAAADLFEKAAQLEPNEPAILTRLGLVQAAMNMPANAERNFRKAIEMEGDDKPSLDFLANVLTQTGRAHEVPGLWRELVEKSPQNPAAHAKLGIALIQSGNVEEGERVFDLALETLENNLLVKRYYAPYLAQQKQDFDRAMDYYEDCLDVDPTDVAILAEYAQTLQAAGRTFEVPKVLKDILATNPDQNTKAQVQAWLLELDQPKRVETVVNAEQKISQGDFEGAVRDLRPMKNWLSEYWKMWLLLAVSLNQIKEFKEAEEAANRLIMLYPGNADAYGQLAQALAGQERHEEAYNVMRHAASNIPNSLPVALNLALAAKRTGREDEARGLAKQIREAVGPNPDIEPMLAEIER
jgi:Flp pilus assembly protein TadD